MLQFFKVTGLRMATRVRTLLAQVRGLGQEGADDDALGLDDVEILQPLGLFVRPVIAAGLELLGVELGEETVGIALLNKALSVLDVETGETRLYGAQQPTARVRLRADGSVDIEALTGEAIRITTAGGGDIVLNGGTLRIARETDPVTVGGAMSTWMAAVTAATGVPALVGTTLGTIAAGAGAPDAKA